MRSYLARQMGRIVELRDGQLVSAHP